MKFYRFQYNNSINDIELKEYRLYKETPKGYWIIPFWLDKYSFRYEDDASLFKKFILKSSRKRFAYPTREEALENYIKRTERYVKILNARLIDANIGLRLANKYTINKQK